MGDGPDSSSASSVRAFQDSLAAARDGVAHNIGELLQSCRPYLLAIAMAELPGDLQGKLGTSDLVQETLVKGVERFGTFQGGTPEELAGWLRRILLNQLANVVKAYGTEKRWVVREQAADSALADAQQLSPSGAALSREEWDLLQDALGRLSGEAREVILMRHRGNLTFAQIGANLGKSEDAVSKIWARGIDSLQRELRRDNHP